MDMKWNQGKSTIRGGNGLMIYQAVETGLEKYGHRDDKRDSGNKQVQVWAEG